MKNADCLAELVERDAWLDLFDAAPQSVRESLGLVSATIGGMSVLGCRALPITELNRAMAVGVERAPSREELDAAIKWLDAYAMSWALQVAPTTKASAIHETLRFEGLAPTGSGWAKFVRTEGAPALEPLDRKVQVEAVGPAVAEMFGATVAGGFGLPKDCATWFAVLVDRPSWRCFLATIDGQPVGGGTMFVQGGCAWFGIEATFPAYRARGVQQHIIAEQVRAAAAMGAHLQTCETGQPTHRDDPGFSSYRNQERAGFTYAYMRPNYKRTS
ncbi:hypothetical protein [Sphingomonas sp. 3-13AW]|uniref:hypothetical protein n=1 Tax=Sphingomonas sp. 3-13AW TaxID=3050450 RepID=UPI003BB516A4